MTRRHLAAHGLLAIAVLSFQPAAEAQAQALTLSEAIASALDTHPSVAAAAARSAAGEEDADAARAARFPALAASATLVRFQEPMVVAPLHSFDPLNPPRFDETLVQAQLGLEYTLFDGGARGSRIRAADAVASAAGLTRESAVHDVLERTVAAYLGVLSVRAVEAAAAAQVDALEAERVRVQQNVDAGSAAEVELVRASATLQQAIAERASAEARVGLAERRLARATGLPVERIRGASLADVDARAEPAPTGGERAAGDPTNPSIERAGRSVAAAEARLAEQRAGHLPRVSASAALQDFGTPEGRHVVEWQAGLRLSWPIFTGGATSAGVRRARAELEAARAERASVELAVAEELDGARTAVAEADARRDALGLAVEQWEEVARIARLALDAGSGVQRDLLEAEAGLFGARAGEAEARYAAVLARVQAARASGTLDTTWIETALEAGR